MPRTGSTSYNKCILSYFIYSRTLTRNSYKNMLEHQYMILYLFLDRREFLGSEEMTQGVEKGSERQCTQWGWTLSHFSEAGRASSVPTSYCPKWNKQQKKNISVTHCSVWPWALYFTVNFPGGWEDETNCQMRATCCEVGHSPQLVVNNCSGLLSDCDTSPFPLHPLAFIWLGLSKAKTCVGLKDEEWIL